MTRELDALRDGHEVHLWYVFTDHLSDERLLAAYRGLLSPDERERNARFVFPQGRHEHLVTRALVRTTLSAYDPAVDPRAWTFATNQFGRPAVSGPPGRQPLQFNLSHTTGMIACLVAYARDVGVDLEDTTRNTGTFEIADRYFSPAEVAALRALPPESQPDRFYDFWTLKEAYIKARGLGLQLPLDQFSFQLEAESPITISFGPQIDDDPASWQFDLRRLTPRHRLALAIHRHQEPDLAVRLRPVVPLAPGA